MEDVLLCLLLVILTSICFKVPGPHPPDVKLDPEPGSWWSECFCPEKWHTFSLDKKYEILLQYKSWRRLQMVLAKN